MKQRRLNIFTVIFLISCISSLSVFGQYQYKGKVKDAITGEPLPFVNVFIKGNSDQGAVTDFNGNYKFECSIKSKYIVASFVGYHEKAKKPFKKNNIYYTNFHLSEDAKGLREVVISAKKENPAFEIMRRMVKNKKKHDFRKLKSYEREDYSKIELSLNSFDSAFFFQNAVFKKMGNIIQSIDSIKSEDGESIVPVYLSETFSKVYAKPPKVSKEVVLKTKINGVGFADGSVMSQIMGSSFQSYNFYRNWVKVINKEFVSPTSNNWKLYYEYFIKDTVRIDNSECYRIEYWPKKDGDLAFEGQLWITTDNYAIKQVDARVGENANINFIDKIKIKQKLMPSELGYWVVSNNRILIDFSDLGSSIPSVVGSFYRSSENYVLNKPKPPEFYIGSMEFDEQAFIGNSEEFWSEKRHEKLSDHDLEVIAVIDTLNNIPTIKRFTHSLELIINGYWRGDGKLNYGPYSTMLSFNDVEIARLGFGIRTNKKFSENKQFYTYLGYGIKDNRPKYHFTYEHVLNRKKWIKYGVGSEYELSQISFLNVDRRLDGTQRLANFDFIRTNNGILARPHYQFKQLAYFQADVRRGLTNKVMIKHKHFLPLNPLYYNPENKYLNSITVSEISLSVRFSVAESFIQRTVNRRSLGSIIGFPVSELTYTRGLKGVLGGEYAYNKLELNIIKRMKMGFFGFSRIVVTGGYIFDDLPLPLLSVHQGNQSVLSNKRSYNLMRDFEFVSDAFISIRVEHSFEGFVFNRIPLLKKLDWRLVTTLNMLQGSLRENNLNNITISEQKKIIDDSKKDNSYFSDFNRGPYIEFSYGIQNILKFIRVDFYHRITYLDNPYSLPFGVKLRVQIVL